MLPQIDSLKLTGVTYSDVLPSEVIVKTGLGRFVWLIVSLLVSSIPVVGQNHHKNPEPCKSNPNMGQADMNECAGRDLRKAESKLEKTLRDIGIRKDSPEQKAWEAYRDAQLAALYPELPVEKIVSEYGSVYPMCYATLKTKLTEGRIRDLKALTSPGEGDICYGYRSANPKHN
jgi:uncharacterized protein YecT (DUF1311 family)